MRCRKVLSFVGSSLIEFNKLPKFVFSTANCRLKFLGEYPRALDVSFSLGCVVSLDLINVLTICLNLCSIPSRFISASQYRRASSAFIELAVGKRIAERVAGS